MSKGRMSMRKMNYICKSDWVYRGKTDGTLSSEFVCIEGKVLHKVNLKKGKSGIYQSLD